MAEGLIISTSMTAVWLPWLLLAAVVTICLGCLTQPRYLHGLLSNSIQTFSLNTAEQTPSIGAQAGQWLLNITIAALCAYSYRQMYTAGYNHLLTLLATAAGIDLYRLAATLLVNYTFDLKRMFSMAYIRYFSLRSICSMLMLIPIMMLSNGYLVPAMKVMIIVMMVAYYLILTAQLGKLYCSSLLDVFFLITYILTVEIIPTLLLYIL